MRVTSRLDSSSWLEWMNRHIDSLIDLPASICVAARAAAEDADADCDFGVSPKYHVEVVSFIANDLEWQFRYAAFNTFVVYVDGNNFFGIMRVCTEGEVCGK